MRRARLLGAALILLTAVGATVPVPVSAASGPPTILNVIRGNGSITVNLAPPGGVLDPSLTYQARCVAGGTVKTSATSTSPTVKVTGLTNGTTWRCEGRANDGSGWSSWSKALAMKPSATPARAPATPASFKMTTGPGLVWFKVKAPDNGGATITGYSARCELGVAVITVDSSSRKFTMGGMSLNRPWSCQVTASNPLGISASSTTKAVTVTAGAVAAGSAHSCSLQYGSDLKCWGYDEQGQIGDGTKNLSETSPQSVNGLPSVPRAIAGGGGQSCALAKNRTVWCWGSNDKGQIGDGTATDRVVPTRAAGLAGVSSIAAGGSHTCAIAKGIVYCWGWNSSGQLGDGTTDTRSIPAPVKGLSKVVSISAGQAHTCAATLAGAVYCWGKNDKGQLGDGTTDNRSTPVAAKDLSGVRTVGVGYQHSCAARVNGTVACWGANPTGELGDGTTDDRLSPRTVPDLTNVTSLAIGGFHSCAVLADQTMVCWGGNNMGQLGDGTTDFRTSPVAVPGVSSVVSASAGFYHSCAQSFSGTVSCWGQNTLGQLGDGTTADRGTAGPVNGTA